MALSRRSWQRVAVVAGTLLAATAIPLFMAWFTMTTLVQDASSMARDRGGQWAMGGVGHLGDSASFRLNRLFAAGSVHSGNIARLDDESSSHRDVSCETIHVTIVCVGYNHVIRLVTMLKSIFFFRSQPLHFHFITSADTERVLRVLFGTWQIPQVKVSYYASEDKLDLVSWVHSRHYSGGFALLKLILGDILPDFVTKTIVLDTDLFFNADIAELWSLFSQFSAGTLVAMVENMSDWYIPGSIVKNPWPAPSERGVNSGVMLLHLKRMADMKWADVWPQAVRRVFDSPELGIDSAQLADQDVFNTVLTLNPSALVLLPCRWNVQLSDNSRAESLCHVADAAVVHWNSPKKLKVEVAVQPHFYNLDRIFQKMDGYLLRRPVVEIACSSGVVKEEASGASDDRMSPSMTADDQALVSDVPKIFSSPPRECAQLSLGPITPRRVQLFVREFDMASIGDDTVSLVTQLSLDRWSMFENIVRQWNGPISAAMWCSDEDIHHLIEKMDASPEFADRSNIALHVVYRDAFPYPVNLLRNVALRHAPTSWVFSLDVDFVPPSGLSARLTHAVNAFESSQKARKSRRAPKPVAMVVAAFETTKYSFKIPEAKEDLLEAWDNGLVAPFRMDVWQAGHAPTNFDKWRVASSPYNVAWQRDFEPYLVMPRTVPSFDESFVGFGWNKVSHIMELAALKYQFIVVPDTFVVHAPHAPSADIQTFRRNAQTRQCVARIKSMFVDRLKSQYGWSPA